MMIESPHLYVNQAPAATPSEVLGSALLADRRMKRGAATILSISHLASMTGTNYDLLRETVARERDPYEVFEISKRSGGRRVIAAPNAWLLDVQRWLLDNSVVHASLHDASFAYRPGRSVAQCARRHVGARWMVKLDIRDFFHSFDERQVFRIFETLGYSRLVAFELARLCTRGAPLDAAWLPKRFLNASDRQYGSMRYWPTRLGYLPQGCPTSGALANALTKRVDEELSEIAEDSSLVYTRYADDIVLSSRSGFSRNVANNVMRSSVAALRKHGFGLNETKSRIIGPGSRLKMLGLLIDGDKVRLTKEVRNRISNHIRGVELFGLQSHATQRGFADDLGFLNHLFGLLDYANDVDRQWAASQRQRLVIAIKV